MSAQKKPVEPTHGQMILAHSYAQDLCHHVYMASLGKEGDDNRSRHVQQAHKLVQRVEELLSGKFTHIEEAA